MNRPRAFIVVILLSGLAVCCWLYASPITRSAAYRGTGVIESISREEKLVLIDHDKIEGQMDAMVMGFHVKDSSLLNGVNAGDRVDFTLETGKGTALVTALKKR